MQQDFNIFVYTYITDSRTSVRGITYIIKYDINYINKGYGIKLKNIMNATAADTDGSYS
jgi:hypothetical protein